MRRTAEPGQHPSSAANGSKERTPVIIAYGRRASNGTPMVAVVSAVAVVLAGAGGGERRAGLEVRGGARSGLGCDPRACTSQQRVPFETATFHRPRTLQTRDNYSQCRPGAHFHTDRTHWPVGPPTRRNNCAWLPQRASTFPTATNNATASLQHHTRAPVGLRKLHHDSNTRY